MKNFSTPLLVVAVAILDGSGRVLMQRRREEAIHGGLWEFPGGKVEPGESPEEAAAREIAEELDLVLDVKRLHPVGFASGRTDDPQDTRPLVILLYRCAHWRGTPRCRVGEALAWHDPRAVSQLAMPPLDYPLAAALTKLI